MTDLLPQTTENEAVQADWRESFLQRILVISSAIGLIALIPAVLSASDLILQSIYIGVFAILVASILIRVPYPVKATIFVLLPLVISVSSMAERGILGDSLFALLAFTTFSALLLGTRSGLIAVFISELAIIAMGYLTLTGQYALSDRLMPEGALGDWLVGGAMHLLISLVILSGLRMLQEGFERARARTEGVLNSLKETQMELEKRVADRTKELARKTDQMAASTFVAHQTASIQELNTLLNSTVDLITKRFGYYHAAIYLTNPRGDYVTLQAASSEGGKRLVEQGYRLRVGVEGIVGFVAAEKKPRIAVDVGEDAYYFDSPDLPDTRSELSLPLIVRDKVIGVLDMQSTEIKAFHYDEIEMFQTLADQIAVAIENSRLLTESQLTISQLEIITSENSRRNWQIESLSRKPAFHYTAGRIQATEKTTHLEGKNILSVPLILRGQKIGKISLQRKDEFQKWTAQEETVAKEVAIQAALALENVRLVERTRQRANREQAIAQMTARIRETLDLDTVLRTTARELQNTLNLEEAEVRLFPLENTDSETGT